MSLNLVNFRPRMHKGVEEKELFLDVQIWEPLSHQTLLPNRNK
jgi:hypothetical protein